MLNLECWMLNVGCWMLDGNIMDSLLSSDVEEGEGRWGGGSLVLCCSFVVRLQSTTESTLVC